MSYHSLSMTSSLGDLDPTAQRASIEGHSILIDGKWTPLHSGLELRITGNAVTLRNAPDPNPFPKLSIWRGWLHR